MSNILWLAAVVYHNCIGGIGYIRGVCDVVCWGSGNMYGNGIKKPPQTGNQRAAERIIPFKI